MADRYQSSGKKSTKKFEVMGSKEVECGCRSRWWKFRWEELQPEVEHLTGLAGLKIIRAVIEDEDAAVGPRHQPNAASSCLRWGQQSGYVVFAGQKVAVRATASAHAARRRSSAR